jgi:hypothetical protein
MANMSRQTSAADDALVSVSNTGFTFGALNVARICTLPKGGAAVRLETPKVALNIRVTKTGKMVVTTDAGIEVLVTR